MSRMWGMYVTKPSTELKFSTVRVDCTLQVFVLIQAFQVSGATGLPKLVLTSSYCQPHNPTSICLYQWIPR